MSMIRQVSGNGVGSSGPGERTAATVVVLDEVLDAGDETAYAAEAATTDGLLGNSPEPALHLIGPG